jgi:surface carbohydrate biosynthesis protein (TIGR04326 family)
LKRSALRGAPRAGWFDGDDAVFFFSYFIHLDAASCASGHFYSRHWEGIPAMLHAAGKRTNWLQHYLQSASVPSTATALDWVQKFDQRPREEGFHTFLDAFLSPRVMRRALASWSRLRRAAGRLRNLERAFTPAGSRMSLWFFMRDDWERSTIGVIAMENALFAALIDEAMRTLPRQRLGVFLNENQAWERAFAHFWRRHGHERLIGVSHSTVRFWDLRYMIDRRTIDDRGPNAIPQADVIALNGPAAVEQFRAMGFPTERMVATEAQRYGYLERQASDRQSKVSTGGATRLLVLGDYHADGTTKMLRLLESAAPLVRSTVRYTVKPHPNFMVKASDYPSLQLEIVTENLGKILGDFDVAYASNNTSAAVDAFFIGMPLIVILDDEELNFSPLRGEPRVPFVSSAEDLAAAIDGLAAPAAGESKGVPFFYLDSTLPRWRGLLTHAQAKPDRA